MAVNDSEALLGLSQTFKRGSRAGPEEAFPSKSVLKDKTRKTTHKNVWGPCAKPTAQLRPAFCAGGSSWPTPPVISQAGEGGRGEVKVAQVPQVVLQLIEDELAKLEVSLPQDRLLRLALAHLLNSLAGPCPELQKALAAPYPFAEHPEQSGAAKGDVWPCPAISPEPPSPQSEALQALPRSSCNAGFSCPV